jgi:hypothetical protein
VLSGPVGLGCLIGDMRAGGRRVNGKIQSQVGAERGGSVSSGLAHGVAAGEAAAVLKSTDAPGLCICRLSDVLS